MPMILHEGGYSGAFITDLIDMSIDKRNIYLWLKCFISDQLCVMFSLELKTLMPAVNRWLNATEQN